MKDLDQILSLTKKNKKFKQGQVLKEKQRILHLIEVNSQRERDTYAKMFSPKKSITDLLNEAILKNPIQGEYKTQEDLEFENDI